jgi:hypothetical protein
VPPRTIQYDIITKDKLVRAWREGEMVYFKALFKHMYGGTGKITKSLTQDGKYPDFPNMKEA